MLNVSGVLRSAESSDCRAGSLQRDTWQEDFCSSAFLLHAGKKPLLGCVCRNSLQDARSSRKEGEIEEEMWNEGVSFSATFMCSYSANPFPLLQSASPAAPSGMPGQPPRSHLPFPPLDGCTGPRLAPGLSPARGAWGGPRFLHFKDCPCCERRKSYGHK